MIYEFRCSTCNQEVFESFLADDYDKKVFEDGRLKRKRCKKCRTMTLYRHITHAPQALGGAKGYVSMERWQRMHPNNTRKLEAELEAKMNERHRKKVLDHIDKQKPSNRKQDRHKDYGPGQKEDRFKYGE